MIHNTVWGVGRNFANHAKEMKAEVPKAPLIFVKPMACLEPGDAIALPQFSSQIDYELEIAVQLGAGLNPTKVALALDLTARDHQKQAKAKGTPWSLAKAFTGALKLSQWIDYKNDHWFNSLTLELQINKQRVQKGNTTQFIFSLPEIIDFLKIHHPLQEGDIILTGTPEGVGPLAPGDQLLGILGNEIKWTVAVTQ